MNTTGPLLTLKEIQTRFLHPFFFRTQSVREACERLLDVTIPSPDGTISAIWESARVHDLYREDLLVHVAKFLFGGEGAVGCDYLRITEVVGQRWFHKTEVHLADGSSYRVRLVTPALIEMYLSSYGAGVLSITLAPETPKGLELNRALDFNYRLSQLRPNSGARLHSPHPSEDATVWRRLTTEQQHNVRTAPNPAGRVFERLGHSGSSFLLAELVDELVQPLGPLQFERAQGQLSVYTVAHFDSDVDLGNIAVRKSIAPFMSSLAQVEEPRHAGSPEGVAKVGNSVLNRCHWFGAGLLGAAHLVADQKPPEHPFNTARMPRLMLKYFTPYLSALMQRIVLHRASQEASEIVFVPRDDATERFVGLRRHLLEFAVDGSFTEISRREVIHRYYRLCRIALGVPEALTGIRRAVADIDAQNTATRQIRIAEDLRSNAEAARKMQERMNEHLGIVAQVQTRIEWIEIVLVSVYVAHLWEIFASHVEQLHRWLAFGVLVGATLGAAIAAFVLKPWRHRRHEFVTQEDEEDQ